jgi:hypothetical protein
VSSVPLKAPVPSYPNAPAKLDGPAILDAARVLAAHGRLNAGERIRGYSSRRSRRRKGAWEVDPATGANWRSGGENRRRTAITETASQRQFLLARAAQVGRREASGKIVMRDVLAVYQAFVCRPRPSRGTELAAGPSE